jgi:DNA-binding response OmpR family regulator
MAKNRILFIEDEEALQHSMGRALEFAGFAVLQALDGEAGVAIAKKEKPDLIMLDLILPKMDGFEVLKALKKEVTTKDIPVMVLTNLESSRDVDKVIAMGATTYLVKANYELKELIAKIKETLATSAKQ